MERTAMEKARLDRLPPGAVGGPSAFTAADITIVLSYPTSDCSSCGNTPPTDATNNT